MIPIYICEDDPKQLEVLSTVIKNRIMIENFWYLLFRYRTRRQ